MDVDIPYQTGSGGIGTLNWPKLSGPATSNYEENYPPLFYEENTKISLYVESLHRVNIFF